MTRDTFLEGLCDLHVKTHEFANAEIKRLRSENAELKSRIAGAPSLLTDLQDRITMLEQVCENRARELANLGKEGKS